VNIGTSYAVGSVSQYLDTTRVRARIIAPAYAGMILAEQGHRVIKWTLGEDPTLTLNGGAELWAWLNHGKTIEQRHASLVNALCRDEFDVVIDNTRAVTWERWGVDPARLALDLDVTWVSLRDDFDQRSFDVVAQARAWGNLGSLPFYVGDTAAGLWLAFKALAAPVGHYVLGQATVLAKLVEGECVVERRDWDEPGAFGFDERGNARVIYRGERIVEPRRDAAWRLGHLPNVDGRFVV